MIVRIALAISTALLSGCSALSDPNAATEENFRAVLEPMVSKLACAPLPTSDPETLARRGANVKLGDPYPLISSIGYGFNFGTREWVEGGVFRGDVGPEDTYLRLSEIGALERRETPTSYTQEQLPFGLGTSQRPHKYVIYTPTNAFKDLFGTITKDASNGQQAMELPAICYGSGKITGIQFTVPEDGDSKSSRVEYTWSAEPLSATATQLYNQSITLVNNPPISGKETVRLVLTNNGWAKMDKGY